MSTKRKGDGDTSDSKRVRIGGTQHTHGRRAVTSNVVSFSDSGSGGRIKGKRLDIGDDKAPKVTPPSAPVQSKASDLPPSSRLVGTSRSGAAPTISFANDHLQSDSAGATEEQPKGKRFRNYQNWNKLAEWLPYRSDFLDEMLRHDGRGDYIQNSSCYECDEVQGDRYRCVDCWDGGLLCCADCIQNKHRALPLHRIEEWTGQFFEKSSLSSLGLRFQLGHGGGACPNPTPGPKEFSVFDVTGVHSVNIDYCACLPPPFGLDKRTQLLRSRLFPATLSRPQTAFTFEMLDHYHQQSLQGKVTLYDYYNTVVKRSDMLELAKIPSRSNDFHRTFRFWRLLLMLKRAGRGNIPNGVFDTKEGDLAIECPACPHPRKNLPDDWEKAGPTLFLYTLFLAVDANFKLKGKNRGLTDMELMPGWAYFVEESKYQSHLAGYVTESEINTCQSEHDAVVRAAVRCTPGYSVTGAALVVCSRHGMVRPNGAGDLQKGERYCNVDYIIFSAIAGVQLSRVVLTYDIACQWVKNFLKRLGKLPERLQPDTKAVSLTAAIPSWHINGHGPSCQVNHALMYTPGCGLTCGDEIEGSFSETNVLGASVREMAPSARHESLNDQWHGSNLRKLVRLKRLLAKKFRDAAEMCPQQEESFANLTLTFTPERIIEWTRMILAWESDATKPNPYEEVKLERTMQDVRLQLAREDEKEGDRGANSAHKMSMTACLVAALDLEEQQHALKYDLKNSRLSTSKQKADLQEKRNAMRARIMRWREAHIVYSPCIVPLLPGLGIDQDTETTLKPEDIPLYLPSALSPGLRHTIPTMTAKELRLREAQADDALADIRLGRRVLTGLTNFKKLHLAGAGNKPNTRVRTLYARVQTKIDKAANRYRRAREALSALDPNGTWQHRLQPLNANDIRGPGRDSGESSGRYIPSWIWQVPRVRLEGDRAMAEEELDESLRVEWAKARARSLRWKEEYLLVQEEMRRVIVYLSWKARWWEEHASRESFKAEDLMHGTLAYAHKQASFCRRLSQTFAAQWIPLLRKYGEMPTWMPWAGYEGSESSSTGRTAENGAGEEHRIDDTEDNDPDVVDEVGSDEEEAPDGGNTDELYEFEIDD